VLIVAHGYALADDRPGDALLPAKGRFLVATEIGGGIFAETVILLLHYDESGAMGFVVNRPTGVQPDEVFDDAVPAYQGALYWGGPVAMASVRALLLTDDPPAGAHKIVGSVHEVTFDNAIEEVTSNPDSVRFYIGYSGWTASQLDHELARGVWHVLPASDEVVFASDPKQLWKRLSPVPEYRASLKARPTVSVDIFPFGNAIEFEHFRTRLP
jgi:putative transcriptional regulator